VWAYNIKYNHKSILYPPSYALHVISNDPFSRIGGNVELNTTLCSLSNISNLLGGTGKMVEFYRQNIVRALRVLGMFTKTGVLN